MLADIRSQRRDMSLSAYCREFDARYGCPQGAGIRVARILMFERALVPDLSSPNLNQEPLSNFVPMASFGSAHMLGGL